MSRGRRIARGVLVALDRLTLAAVVAGVGMVLQPWWSDGFRIGFFFTIGAIVAQIAASHAVPEERG